MELPLVLTRQNPVVDTPFVRQHHVHLVGILDHGTGSQDVPQQVIEVGTIGARDVGSDLATLTVQLVALQAGFLEHGPPAARIGLTERLVGQQLPVLRDHRLLIGRQFIDRPPDFDERIPHHPSQQTGDISRHILFGNLSPLDRLGQLATIPAAGGHGVDHLQFFGLVEALVTRQQRGTQPPVGKRRHGANRFASQGVVLEERHQLRTEFRSLPLAQGAQRGTAVLQWCLAITQGGKHFLVRHRVTKLLRQLHCQGSHFTLAGLQFGVYHFPGRGRLEIKTALHAIPHAQQQVALDG